jgi:uncharacterized membrane protein
MKDLLPAASAWDSVVQSLRHPPVDVLAVLLLVAFADLVVLFAPPARPGLRLLAGTLLLVALPGYAIVSALFPAWRNAPEGDPEGDEVRVSTGGLLQRLALLLGAGLALIPVFALVLDGLGVGLSAWPAAAALTAVVVAGLGVTVTRRGSLPAARRFRFGAGRWIDDIRRSFSPSGPALAVELLLVVAVIAATATLGGALAFPVDGESYSSFALRTEAPDGSLIAGEFPDELTAGENGSFVATVENHENAPVDYTVVVQLQRVQVGPDGPRTVEWRELSRAERTLAPGEQWRHDHTIRPGTTGEGMRLTYLLYQGDVPSTPRRDNADRSLYVWVDITE